MALIEHLEKLRHFYKLTLYSSINEAATKTGMSQAGLSKSLILLERELSCKLFNRSREGLTLTREGADVLRVTKKILSDTSDLENRLQSLRASSTPKVIRIGMYDSIAVYLGVELQKYLKKIYPKVTLHLRSESSAALLERIEASELDIAVGVNFSHTPKLNVKYWPLFDDHYSFYKAASLANSVEETTYLIHEGAADKSGSTLDKILRAELKNKIVHRIQNFETLKSLTVQGLGVGVLPTQVARPLITTGELIQIHPAKHRQLFGQHNIGFLVRSETADAFSDFIQDILRVGSRWMKI
ncbi:MAG: LysR family transcriptional regulator [Bdellovibrionales bacterium]